MEFNRLISLVLGFIVLILVFVWISNRFRASTRLADGRTPTITPTYTPTPSKAEDKGSSWNPLSFFTRNNTNSPSPIARNVSPSPTQIKVKVQENISVSPSKTISTVIPTKKTNGIAQKPSPTSVKVQLKQVSPKPTSLVYKNNKTGKTLTQIPETGAPSALLPLMLGGLSWGIYLRRKV